jgi:hypothetical protein
MVLCTPTDVRDESNKDNYLINNHKEMVATSLNMGQHFTIIAIEDNVEGDDFWVLIYEETLSMVEKVNKTNCWGQEIFKGEQIIVGKYYKRQGHHS